MNKKILRITVIGLMAALSYISFTFLRIDIPTPAGSTSFHLGNTFCVLAALLLGGLPGGLSGALGMGIGDMFHPVYITVVPKTLILKTGIGLVCGFVAHKLLKITEQTGRRLFVSVIIATSCGMLFNVICEPFFSYFYTSIVLGAPEKAALTLASWNAVTTTVNAVLAVIISTGIYMAMVPTLRKSGVLKKLEPSKES